jgi:hypothetical protein
MTGNAAQHISESDWPRTLVDIRNATRPGGWLAFESRNPRARAWDHWSTTERSTRETPHGPLVEWMAADEVDPGTVRIRAFNLFTETGEEIVEEFDLRFRSLEAISTDLRSAGFAVDAVYGDWSRTPFHDEAPLMVFVAQAQKVTKR